MQYFNSNSTSNTVEEKHGNSISLSSADFKSTFAEPEDDLNTAHSTPAKKAKKNFISRSSKKIGKTLRIKPQKVRA